MEGAAVRLQGERAHIWWAAMMPHCEKPPGFEEFTGIKPDRATLVERWAKAWDRADNALAGSRAH